MRKFLEQEDYSSSLQECSVEVNSCSWWQMSSCSRRRRRRRKEERGRKGDFSYMVAAEPILQGHLDFPWPSSSHPGRSGGPNPVGLPYFPLRSFSSSFLFLTQPQLLLSLTAYHGDLHCSTLPQISEALVNSLEFLYGKTAFCIFQIPDKESENISLCFLNLNLNDCFNFVISYTLLFLYGDFVCHDMWTKIKHISAINSIALK